MDWTGLEHSFCNTGQGSSGRMISTVFLGPFLLLLTAILYLDQRWVTGLHSGSDVPHRRGRRRADGHLIYIGCSAKRWDRMDSDTREERGEREYGWPRGYALAGRELELGIGGWELERHQCWQAGRGTGVRLAVTLHSVDPAFSRFTLHY
jgi:hypothetical protein